MVEVASILFVRWGEGLEETDAELYMFLVEERIEEDRTQ